MNSIKFLLGLLKGHRTRYFSTLLLGGINSFIPLVSYYLVKIIVDDVFMGSRKQLFIPILITLIIIVVARMSIWYYVRMTFEYIGQKAVINIRMMGFKKILSLDFSFFDKTRTGDLMTRMTADLELIRHFIANNIYDIAEQGVIFFGALAFMVSVADASFFVLISIVLPATAYIAIRLAFSIKPKYRKNREMRAILNTVAQENIEANRVVKAFGREEYENERMREASENFKDACVDASVVWRKYMPYLANMQTIFVCYNILVGGSLVIYGHLTMGELVMFNSMTWMITGPLSKLGFIVNDMANTMASVEKVLELLDTEPFVQPIIPEPMDVKIRGDILFVNVSFGYGGDSAVKNINLHIRKGEKIAFMGPTGCGKSTIINLISRFYDVDHGVILIDGEDIKNIDINVLRNSIAVAQQDVFLFSETIAANIAYGNTNASMEDIMEAAKEADAHNFITQLPDGYNTIVGERGMGLSGGQKQRLTLARALLKKPSILVLDDVTSALDANTEREIQESLVSEFGDKTVFIVSQRISSVKDCDQIIVLEDGEITERGTHEELLKNQKYYYNVYCHQYGEIEAGLK